MFLSISDKDGKYYYSLWLAQGHPCLFNDCDMRRSIWLEMSAVIGKKYWFKLLPHSMQEVLDVYPAG